MRVAASAPACPLLPPLMQPFVDQTRSTTDSGRDGYGLDRAVAGAGATLHASIAISQQRLPGIDQEYLVRTDFDTATATDAGRPVQHQGDNTIQVAKSAHS